MPPVDPAAKEAIIGRKIERFVPVIKAGCGDNKSVSLGLALPAPVALCEL